MILLLCALVLFILFTSNRAAVALGIRPLMFYAIPLGLLSCMCFTLAALIVTFRQLADPPTLLLLGSGLMSLTCLAAVTWHLITLIQILTE